MNSTIATHPPWLCAPFSKPEITSKRDFYKQMKSMLWMACAENQQVIVVCVGLNHMLKQAGSEWKHELEANVVQAIEKNTRAGCLTGRVEGGNIAVLLYGCKKLEAIRFMILVQRAFCSGLPPQMKEMCGFSFGLAQTGGEEGDSLKAMQMLVRSASGNMALSHRHPQKPPVVNVDGAQAALYTRVTSKPARFLKLCK